MQPVQHNVGDGSKFSEHLEKGHTISGSSCFGIKHDSVGKLDWSCIPLEILEPLVEVFQAGAVKYEFMNCLKPFENGDRRFFAAGMRHKVASQLDPLAKDEETGCYHAAQDAWNSLMRLYHARKGQ